jgi:hypothetical protein
VAAWVTDMFWNFSSVENHKIQLIFQEPPKAREKKINFDVGYLNFKMMKVYWTKLATDF